MPMDAYFSTALPLVEATEVVGEPKQEETAAEVEAPAKQETEATKEETAPVCGTVKSRKQSNGRNGRKTKRRNRKAALCGLSYAERLTACAAGKLKDRPNPSRAGLMTLALVR
jgi:hypothetical protein